MTLSNTVDVSTTTSCPMTFRRFVAKSTPLSSIGPSTCRRTVMLSAVPFAPLIVPEMATIIPAMRPDFVSSVIVEEVRVVDPGVVVLDPVHDDAAEPGDRPDTGAAGSPAGRGPQSSAAGGEYNGKKEGKGHENHPSLLSIRS